MRVLVGLAALIAVEITVLVLVGQQIGLLGLVGVLIASALVGGWALKREGRRSWTALLEAARRGRPAEAEVADGMFVVLAGLLLVVPGLVTTAAALVLLLPPVRRAFARRMAASAVRAGSARGGPSVTVIGVGGSTYGAGGPGDVAGYGAAGPGTAGPGPAASQHGARPFAGRIIEAPSVATDPDEPPHRRAEPGR